MTKPIEVRDRLAIGCRFRPKSRRSNRTVIASRRGVITELSVEGCSIQSSRIDLERSNRILITIGMVEEIEAIIQWSLKGEFAAVRFARPLCARQMRHIARAANRSGHAIKKFPVYLDAAAPVKEAA